MPQLTEKDLAKIYPTPKTYDELEDEKRHREEENRPKFVALKIASWMTLIIPIALTTWYSTQQIIAKFSAPSSMLILAGVCLTMLVCILGLALIYYLWWRTEKLVYKTMVANSLFRTATISVLVVAAGIGALIFIFEYGIFTASIVTMLLTFISTFAAAKIIK